MNVLLASNRKPKCCVLLDRDRPTRVERFAAAELARYLSRISGAKIRVEKSAQRGLVPIRIGLIETRSTLRLHRARDGFAIEVTPRSVRILGENPRATLQGVYAFLEELGCRWFYPLEDHQVVPRADRLETKMGRRTISHRIAIRSLNIEPCHARNRKMLIRFIDWMAKNHYNGFGTHPGSYGNGYDFWATDVIRWPQVAETVVRECRKRGIQVCQCSHSLHYFMPPEELYAEHPDWYTLRPLAKPGKGYPGNKLAAQLMRYYEDPTQGRHHYELPDSTACWPRWLTRDGDLEVPHQLCFSNQAAVAEYERRVLCYIDSGPGCDVFGPWPADAGGACECAACKANPDAVFNVTNRIAKRLRESHPAMQVEHLVYGANTYRVPKRSTDVSENLVFFLCCPNETKKRWAERLAETGHMGYMGDYVCCDNYARQGSVLVRPAHAYGMIDRALDLGLEGTASFFIETTSWWRSCLNMHLVAKASLSRPPAAEKVLKDFCRHYFGKRGAEALGLLSIAAQDRRIPLELTGHSPYSREETVNLRETAASLKKLVAPYGGEDNRDPRFQRLVRYLSFVEMVVSAADLRVRARRARSHEKRLEKMLEVARLEEALLGLCRESHFAGDGVLDARFFFGRRWERFERDVELLRKPFSQ